jgi:V8-like Glu-specific endopeptidase
VSEILPNGLLVHDCAVMPGDSGAPLIRSNGDAIEIVGVNVASARINGIAEKIAVPASSFDRAREVEFLNKGRKVFRDYSLWP